MRWTPGRRRRQFRSCADRVRTSRPVRGHPVPIHLRLSSDVGDHVGCAATQDVQLTIATDPDTIDLPFSVQDPPDHKRCARHARRRVGRPRACSRPSETVRKRRSAGPRPASLRSFCWRQPGSPLPSTRVPMRASTLQHCRVGRRRLRVRPTGASHRSHEAERLVSDRDGR